MALDFPASPSGGATYTGPGGIVWQWDTQKWVNGNTVVAYAPVASPAFTGNPTAPTPSPGDADTSIATTAFVAATVPGTNFAHNTGFTINQRSYVSGTALAAGAFGHDRWKGGAGGCTYTFAAPAGPANTITITVGTLQQVIEGLAIAGGNYVLSWTGTAQGRVGAGSYAASPVSVAGIVAGANTTIEFNTGTLGQVKFESGTLATPWQALDPATQLQQCQRFYQATSIQLVCIAATSFLGSFINVVLPVVMRGVPVITPTHLSGTGTYGMVAAGSATQFTAYLNGSPIVGNYEAFGVTLSADL